MKKCKTDPTYVILENCCSFKFSDIFCNWCNKSVCSTCARRCRICETMTCGACQDDGSNVCLYCKEGKEGKRDSWIDSTKKVHQGKRFRTKSTLRSVSKLFERGSKEVDEFRKKTMHDSLIVWVKQVEYGHLMGLDEFECDYIAKCFPLVSEFVETEAEGPKRLTEFLKCLVGSVSIWTVLVYAQDRLVVFDLLKDYMREHPVMVEGALQFAIKHEDGGELVKILTETFNPEFVPESSLIFFARNIPGVDFCLRKGLSIEKVDVLQQNAKDFIMGLKNQKLIEYLINKGASITTKSDVAQPGVLRWISFSSLEVILKKKGDDFIHQIPLALLLPFECFIDFYECYELARLLRKLKYSISKEMIHHTVFMVAMLCFGYIKFEELNEGERRNVASWIKRSDVKVNSNTLPFLCDEIKQRMKVFLLCVQRTVGYIGKDLRMTLLDAIWSPVECRGQ